MAWTLGRKKADKMVVSNRHTHGEIASDWALGMGGVLVEDGEVGAGRQRGQQEEH